MFGVNETAAAAAGTTPEDGLTQQNMQRFR